MSKSYLTEQMIKATTEKMNTEQLTTFLIMRNFIQTASNVLNVTENEFNGWIDGSRNPTVQIAVDNYLGQNLCRALQKMTHEEGEHFWLYEGVLQVLIMSESPFQFSFSFTGDVLIALQKRYRELNDMN